jgi:hypothetical protein
MTNTLFQSNFLSDFYNNSFKYKSISFKVVKYKIKTYLFVLNKKEIFKKKEIN